MNFEQWNNKPVKDRSRRNRTRNRRDDMKTTPQTDAQAKRRTIYCPACGNLCAIVKDGGIDLMVRCSRGHGWSLTINDDAPTSSDGTEILGFQCNGTPTWELPQSAIDAAREALRRCVMVLGKTDEGTLGERAVQSANKALALLEGKK